MSETQQDLHVPREPSTQGAPLFFVLLLIPLLGGLAGGLLWFVPNPEFKLVAILVGTAYTALIYLLTWLLAGVNFIERYRSAGVGGAQIVGILVAVLAICAISAEAAYATVPAVFTQLYGRPTARSFVVADVYRHTSKGSAICPFTVTLHSLDGKFDTDFCARWSSAHDFHVGEKVRLHGKETSLGFRFDSYDFPTKGALE